ncbi:hypothetical protein Prum_012460 [Phytohabitans rumicis]|uniref:Uncharacterized protein n=1 Tax=Phytohabitans rumicis TaxID=1076125 RepID=A0A6V8KUU0_9ACTN|nr:hypothetical protein Prum_012460 [Phytohabitans rumicis]
MDASDQRSTDHADLFTVFCVHVGSTNTGNTVAGSASMPASGTNVNWPADTSAATVAVRGSTGGAATPPSGTLPAADRAAGDCPGWAPRESHIDGVGPSNTTAPEPSTADTTPVPASVRSDTPDSSVVNATRANAVFLAAFADRITNRCVNASTSARTRKSTPGSTSR